MKIAIETERIKVQVELGEAANTGEIIKAFTSMLTGVTYQLEGILDSYEAETERLRNLLHIKEEV